MKKFLTMACALACAMTSLTSCDDDDDNSFDWSSVVPSLKATIGNTSYDHKAFYYEKSGNNASTSFFSSFIPTSGTAIVGTSTSPYFVVVFGGQESGTYTESTSFNPMNVLNNGLTNGDWSTGVNVDALVVYRGAGDAVAHQVPGGQRRVQRLIHVVQHAPHQSSNISE